jgi:hypothetical protein
MATNTKATLEAARNVPSARKTNTRRNQTAELTPSPIETTATISNATVTKIFNAAKEYANGVMGVEEARSKVDKSVGSLYSVIRSIALVPNITGDEFREVAGKAMDRIAGRRDDMAKQFGENSTEHKAWKSAFNTVRQYRTRFGVAIDRQVSFNEGTGATELQNAVKQARAPRTPSGAQGEGSGGGSGETQGEGVSTPVEVGGLVESVRAEFSALILDVAKLSEDGQIAIMRQLRAVADNLINIETSRHNLFNALVSAGEGAIAEGEQAERSEAKPARASRRAANARLN